MWRRSWLIVAATVLGPALLAGCAVRAEEDIAGDATVVPPVRPAVLVPVDYRPPAGRVPSTGAYLPENGKPTLIFVDAIWCPFCALARPVVHSLRPEYQERVNFVILDYDLKDDRELAAALGISGHPTFAVVPPGGQPSAAFERRFGPQLPDVLRALLDRVAEEYATPGASRSPP